MSMSSWRGPCVKTEGKYELIDGVVIMQQSQQWGHAKVKAAVYVALDAKP